MRIIKWLRSSTFFLLIPTLFYSFGKQKPMLKEDDIETTKSLNSRNVTIKSIGSKVKAALQCDLLVHDCGRLGNQIFQYATIAIWAKTLGKQACISKVNKLFSLLLAFEFYS